MAGQGTGSAWLNIDRNSNERERETDMKVEREIGRKCRESEKRCENKSKIETDSPPHHHHHKQQNPSIITFRRDG